MNHARLFLCALLLLLTAPLPAFADRIEDLADRLSRQAEDQARRDYDDMYRRRGRLSRPEIESLFASQQFTVATNLFRQMVSDRRSASELQDSLTLLLDQARRAGRSGSSGRNQWNDIQRTLDDIGREIRYSGGGSSGGGGVDDDRTTGRMTWRGRVDDTVQIEVRGSDAYPRTIAGADTTDARFTFTSSLPRRRVTVSVNKTRGRGRITIVQQPAPTNDFTAVIEIRDSSGGGDTYEFELTWR